MATETRETSGRARQRVGVGENSDVSAGGRWRTGGRPAEKRASRWVDSVEYTMGRQVTRETS
jgi:hypothetical protein